ncbi:MAG: pilin [Candidatus Curtissbacteria bacterium]|nr:pilin [Candidatus Curtissbacteria bacterium]
MDGPAQITDILDVLQRIISLLAPAAGIAFFVMLIVGGFKYITSGGDPKNVGQAQSILTYAVIGIVLVVASWLILQLIGRVTGVDVTTVRIPE